MHTDSPKMPHLLPYAAPDKCVIIISINSGGSTSIRYRITIRHLSCAGLCALVLFVFFGASLSKAVDAAGIGQSFETSDATAAGALVSLKEGNKNTVELATQERAEKLIGVVGDKPLLSIGETAKSIQVITSGVTVALVSDINGTVAAGDKITASAIAGVGQKATASSVVVGTAQADLDLSKTAQRDITDTDGTKHTVHVGSVPVQINVMFYAAPNEKSSFLPSFLQDFANGVVGKEVSPVRVLIAAIIMLLSFVSIAVLLYASVKSSIISIGRNPLSEVSVRKSLLQIGAIVVAILLLALITIYLILST